LADQEQQHRTLELRSWTGTPTCLDCRPRASDEEAAEAEAGLGDPLLVEKGAAAQGSCALHPAITSKLPGCDLVRVRIRDLLSGGRVRARAMVIQQETGRPVQIELLEPARINLLDWSKDPAALWRFRASEPALHRPRNQHRERGAEAIIDPLVNLGRSLDIEVVAKGVETCARHDFREDSGCRYGRGYLFGKAAAARTPELRADPRPQLPAAQMRVTVAETVRAAGTQPRWFGRQSGSGMAHSSGRVSPSTFQSCLSKPSVCSRSRTTISKGLHARDTWLKGAPGKFNHAACADVKGR
jgi:hypothetical protein